MEVVEQERATFFDHNRPPFVPVTLDYKPSADVRGPQKEVMVNPRVLKYKTLVAVNQLKLHRTATVTLALKNIAMSYPAADYYGHPRSKEKHENEFFEEAQLIEDDTRELLSAVLEGCGATVTTASSVREALDVFAAWKADVLVCDIGMPEQDGGTFIRAIRQLPREKGRDIPAIALTGYVRVEDRARVLQAGYQMFVPKPIEASELCSMISNLINGSAQS
jgi:CheY-like chemotaxis protein